MKKCTECTYTVTGMPEYGFCPLCASALYEYNKEDQLMKSCIEHAEIMIGVQEPKDYVNLWAEFIKRINKLNEVRK